MNTISIAHKNIEVRSLREKELREYNLKEFGYTTSYYMPPKNDDGSVDFEKCEKGKMLILSIVFGDSKIEEIDQAGGINALNRIYLEVMRATYADGFRDGSDD